MAALAADGLFGDAEFLVSRLGLQDPPHVADQAARLGRALETAMFGVIVAGGHAPGLPRDIPGERRFQQKTIGLDQIAARVVPRADEIADRIVGRDVFFAALVNGRFAVPHLPVGAIHSVRAAAGRVYELRVGRLDARIQIAERFAVRRLAKALVFARMAGAAGFDAHESRFGRLASWPRGTGTARCATFVRRPGH